MPTYQQLIRINRKKIKVKSKAGALKGCPQRRGICTRVYIITPKKTEFSNAQSSPYPFNIRI
jgi:small subunit ribosomal protein S12